MRGLLGLALLIVPVLVPGACAQTGSSFLVELDDPVLDRPAPAPHGRLPVGAPLFFNASATITFPDGAVCPDRVLLDFAVTSLPAGLTVTTEPSRLVIEPSSMWSPSSGHTTAQRVSTRLNASFAASAPAFQEHTFRLSVVVHPEGQLPCNVQEAGDARYVKWTPDFRPEFTLDALPRVSDEDRPQMHVVNFANADARFEMAYGRSNGDWVPANGSFRLGPASQSRDLDRTVIGIDESDVPDGFDGRVSVTQHAADETYPEAPTLTQVVRVGEELGVARLQAYAREEAPGVEVVPFLAAVTFALVRRRGPS